MGQKHAGSPVQGRVYLVGSGPGEEGLFTLRGKELLEAADVVVYDRLGAQGVLHWARPDAERIDVGKHAGFHPVPQQEIQHILIERARAGKRVVRLKGGDPYVFGRGGEEGEALRRAGIAFEVVPGVSSAISGPAYAGIPLTYRNEARSFHVITAHRANDAQIDYEALAHVNGTLVFLMGLAELDHIMEGLRSAGMPEETPVAVISHATLPSQRTVEGTLLTISGQVRREELEAPALIVVGTVLHHRSALNWFEERPLFGMSFVLFRDADRASASASKIRAQGGRAIVWPLLSLNALEAPEDQTRIEKAIAHLKEMDWIFFTSAQGVRYFFQALLQYTDLRAVAGLRFAVIGEKTAKALREWGIHPDYVSPVAEGVAAAQGLIAHFQETEGVSARPAVLFPRAREGREEVVNVLASGCALTLLPVYETKMTEGEPPELPEEGAVFLFTSSSVVRALMRHKEVLHSEAFRRGMVVAIGPVTEKALRENGIRVDLIADESSIEGMIQKVWEAKHVSTHA